MSHSATSPIWPMSLERGPSSMAARGRATARMDALEFKELRYSSVLPDQKLFGYSAGICSHSIDDHPQYP